MLFSFIDIISLILILLGIFLLFKSKLSDITGLIKRKYTSLYFLFILLIIAFIIRLYFKIEEISLISSLIFLFFAFDIDRKITFNKKIDTIKRSIQSKLINPKLEQIKDEESNFEKEKLSIEKQKEKIEEMQIKLEAQKQDLIEREFELKEKTSNLSKLEKELKKQKKPKKKKSRKR